MDNQIIDKFICHLSQQNYEVCYEILDDYEDDMSIKRFLQGVVIFEINYYNFTYVLYRDAIRERAIRDIFNDCKNEIENNSDKLCEEILEVVSIQIDMSELYKRLSKADYKLDDYLGICEGLLKQLDLSNDLLAPFTETVSLELNTIKNLVLASKNISGLNYVSTILSLTQAHSSVRE